MKMNCNVGLEQHDALGFGRTKKDSLQEAYEYINEHVTQTEMAV